MGVMVRIPSQIGRVYGAHTWEQIEARDVAEVVAVLNRSFPGISDRLTEPNGQPRRWVNFYVDGEDIRMLGGMQTPLREGAEVYIVPSVAGGR